MTIEARKAIELLLREAQGLRQERSYDHARRLASLCARAARAARDHGNELRALIIEAGCLKALNKFEDAWVRYCRVLRDCYDPAKQAGLEAEGIVRELLWAHVECAECARLSPTISPQQVLPLLDAADAWLQSVGHPEWSDGLKLQRGLVLRSLGNKLGALDCLGEAVTLKRSHPESPCYPLDSCLVVFAESLRLTNRLTEAEERYQEVLDTPDAVDANRYKAREGLVECALARKDFRSAAGHAQAAVSLATDDEQKRLALNSLVTSLLEAQDLDAADQGLSRLIKLARRLGSRHAMRDALGLAARVALARNEMKRIWLPLDAGGIWPGDGDGSAEAVNSWRHEILIALFEKASRLYGSGSHMAAAAMAGDAAELARTFHDFELAVRAEMLVVSAYQSVSDARPAAELLDRLLSTARRAAPEELLLDALLLAVRSAASADDWDVVWKHFDELRDNPSSARRGVCRRVLATALERASALFKAGNYQAAREHAEKVDSRARALGDFLLEIRARSLEADCWRELDPPVALERFTSLHNQVRELAETLLRSDRELLASVIHVRLRWLEVLAARRPRSGSQLELLLDEIDALLKVADCSSWRAGVLAMRGHALEFQGRRAEAVGHLEAAVALQKRRPDTPGFARAHHLNGLGEMLRKLDRTKEAVQCYQEALAIEAEDVATRRCAFVALSDLALRSGDVSRALAYAQQALALAERTDSAFLLCDALGCLYRAQRKCSTPEERLKTAERRLGSARSVRGRPEVLFYSLLDAAEAAFDKVEPLRACQLLDEARGIATPLDKQFGGRRFAAAIVALLNDGDGESVHANRERLDPEQATVALAAGKLPHDGSGPRNPRSIAKRTFYSLSLAAAVVLRWAKRWIGALRNPRHARARQP